MLNRRYAVGLSVVALLVVLNQAVVQPPLVRLTTDAPRINVAGRQRMLSQRLAKAALALNAATDQAERRRYRRELAGVLSLWARSHARLRDGEKARAGDSPTGGPVVAEFDAIEPAFQQLHAACTRLIAAADGGAEGREGLAAVLRTEAEFLPAMERIVGLYEREARDRVNRLIVFGWVLTALVLTALAGIGLFVLRPSARVIQSQFEELARARADLERRVEERTRAVERVNRDLAAEVDRRARAEERQRALLEQFSHVARTTTVGEMASGLAHELNQPLGAVANYAEGCLVALDAPEPDLGRVREVLGKVLATTLRAGEIVQRIRRFVTRHEPAREPFSPDRLVREVEEFFRDEARRLGIALRIELAPDLPNLWCDPVQVQQVLVNLVRNAFDALRVAQPVEPSVVMKAGPDGSGGVEFAVADNGEGIPGAQLGRVFDAFFSTRDEGMGMGLAISRTIIEAHQGTIGVDSVPGVRTTFRFTLPAADDHEDRAEGIRR